jgi:hypothetical protein
MGSSRPLVQTATLRRIKSQKFRAILNVSTSNNANHPLFAIPGGKRVRCLAKAPNKLGAVCNVTCHLLSVKSYLDFTALLRCQIRAI